MREILLGELVAMLAGDLMPDAPRLKPCPFCGKEPNVENVGDNRSALMIDCVTDDCVGPSVSCYDHTEAIRQWNRRDGDK